MGSKFIPPPDQINNISPKKTKKSFSNNSNQSIFSEIKKVIKESFAADAFEQVGQMNAVVLEVRDIDVMAMLWRHPLMFWQFMMNGSIPDYIEIRFRIPSMHAHLPEPSGPDNWLAINLHPLALMKKDKGSPVPGDIVTLDFQDKNNFKGAMVIETLNTNDPNKNPGGNCTASSTHGTAAPPLNMTAPSGDSQTSAPEEYSATNSPAQEGREEGISYPNQLGESLNSFFSTPGTTTAPTTISVTQPDGTHAFFTPSEYKQVIYYISLDEIQSFSDFKNVDNVVSSLLSKKVAAVCISVAEADRKLRDIKKLKRIIKNLSSSNLDVGLSFNVSDVETEQFHDNFIHMAEIAKSTKIKFVMYDLHDVKSTGTPATWDTNELMDRHYTVFRNFCDNLSLKFYCLISDSTLALTSSIFPQAHQADTVFISANHYDNNDNYNYSTETVLKSKYDSPTATNAATTQGINIKKMYYLGGINFTAKPSEPCRSGDRTNDILREQLEAIADPTAEHQVMISNYDVLNEEKATLIAEELELPSATTTEFLDSSVKQNFLSSTQNTQKTDKSKVTDILGTIADIIIEEASFNSGSDSYSSTSSGTGTSAGGASSVGSTQSADTAPAAAQAASPGIQCTPIPTTQPMPGGGPAGAGAGGTVDPPSFRFDSIENFQDLGWTANNSAAINNVIFDFMQSFSAAVYRRLPANSASFTGSNPKKIRLTSTARTFEKQAELMWDKIKNGGGDSAVYSLYGRKDWTTAVVNAYHAQNFQAAVDAVAARVASGGGSAHLKGKGVDIHTWSHLQAEGVPNATGASIGIMNNAKFVQAITEAAKEVGASPVVEAYQQHVHITIF